MTVRIIPGPALEVLKELPDKSVHSCITSPPYWGLRSYHGEPGMIGLEDSWDEHLANLMAVFDEVWRVLRDDGTFFLNYGDAYAGSWGNYNPGNTNGGQRQKREDRWDRRAWADKNRCPPAARANAHGFKPKDLMMLGARLAIALQEAGWYLRSEIIIHKKNPTPECVQDRPSVAHEKVFLLTKKARYFWDAEAVRTESSAAEKGRGNYRQPAKDREEPPRHQANGPMHKGLDAVPRGYGGNMKNVLSISSNGFPGAHFATFAPDMIEPFVKAGTSEKGVCGECGAPWVRQMKNNPQGAVQKWVTERAPMPREEIAAYLKTHREKAGLSKADVDRALGTTTLYSWFEGRPAGIEVPTVEQWKRLKGILALGDDFDEQVAATVQVLRTEAGIDRSQKARRYKRRWVTAKITEGWAQGCECNSLVVPARVLDPFAGAGTTGLVCDRLGRDSILIEISTRYALMAHARIKGDSPLFADVRFENEKRAG